MEDNKTPEEIKKEEDAQKAKEAAAAEAAAGSSSDGDEPETPQSVVDANAAAERIEKANAEAKVQNDRAEAAEARKALGGSSEAGSGPAKKKEDTRTDDEKANDYADKVQAGEANPMKDDGFM